MSRNAQWASSRTGPDGEKVSLHRINLPDSLSVCPETREADPGEFHPDEDLKSMDIHPSDGQMEIILSMDFLDNVASGLIHVAH
jgi:hypothetical protein